METPIADTQEVFNRVFIAAQEAVCELDNLCERYDVPYLEYSKVYNAIMGICEEVTPNAESEEG